MNLHLITLLVIGLASFNVRAAVPLPVSTVELGGEVYGASGIARQAPVLVVCVGKPCTLTLLDISNPNQPKRRGKVALEKPPSSLALDANGGFGVAVLSPDQAKPNETLRHVVVGLDLTLPDAAAIAWRKEIDAVQVRALPDAKAVLTTILVPKPGFSPTLEFLVTPTEKAGMGSSRRVAETTHYSPPTIVASSDGRYLAWSNLGWDLTGVEVAGQSSTTFQQMNKNGTFTRYDKVLAVLNSGHVLVRDLRSPSIGVYALAEDMPRRGFVDLESDDGYGAAIPTQGQSPVFVSHTLNGTIEELDVGMPSQPRLKERWSLPPSTFPIAVGRDRHLYATSGSSIAVIRLQKPTTAPLDWSHFEKVHAEAMQTLAGQKSRPEFLRELDANHVLDRGRFQEALNLPIWNISPKRAAMLLNDYGYLNGRRGRQVLAEAALRRAIELDPARQAAYLNLADTLRVRLADKTGQSRVKAAAEIERHYRRYLKLGGKATPAIAAFLGANPSRTAQQDSCSGIADYANSGNLTDLFVSGKRIEAGGRRIQVAVSYQGTAHVPNLDAWDAKTDFPIDISTPAADDSLWGGDHLGLVAFGNDVHVLHYRDKRYPVASVSLTSDASCQFRTQTREVVAPESLDPALCKKIAEDDRPAAIAFKTPAWIVHDKVRDVYSETHAGNMRMLDFANDGKAGYVVAMQLASGAGAGCDAEFFELLDPSGNRISADTGRHLLHELQSIDSKDRYPVRPCGNQARFFSHAGKTHFESRSRSWPPRDESGQHHLVRRIEGGKVVDVCRFRFESRTSAQ